MKQTFETTLILAGKTATGFEIPAEIVESFNEGKKFPVKVTINGYSYRNTIAVMGKAFMLGVSAEHRAGSGVKAGDVLNVTLELDTEPRVVEIPENLLKIFAENPRARINFEALSHSKKQGLVLPIKAAKTEATLQKRLAQTLQILLGNT